MLTEADIRAALPASTRGRRNKRNRDAINGKHPETEQPIALTQIPDPCNHDGTKLSRRDHCDGQTENVICSRCGYTRRPKSVR